MALGYRSLVFDISANVAKLAQDLNQVTTKFQQMGNAVNKVFGAISITGAAYSIKALVDNVTAAGEEFLKLSKQTGLTVEEVQKLQFTAEQSETDFGALTLAISRMNKSIYELKKPTSETAKELHKLGFTVKDIGNAPLENFMKMADAISKIDNASKRAAFASVVFARGYKEVLPVLALGREGIMAYFTEAEKLGIMSEEMARKSDEFRDAIKRLEQSLKYLGATLLKDVIPALTNFVELLNSILKGEPMGQSVAIKQINEYEERIKLLKKELATPPNWWSALIDPAKTERLKKELTDLEEKVTALKQKWLTHAIPGQPTGLLKPPPIEEEEEKKYKSSMDWAWELGKLKAQMMEEEDQLVKKLKKEEQDRWEQNIRDRVAYDEYMRRSAEEQMATIRQIKDLEISHQLAVIDLKEQSFALSAKEANEQRLKLYQDELANLNEQYNALVGISDKGVDRLLIDLKIDEVNRKILDSLRLQDELSGTVLEGLIEGVNRYLRDAQTAFQGGLQIVQDVTMGMKDAFDTFLDYTSDKFMDFKELILDILHDIYTAIMRSLVIEPFTEALLAAMPGGGGKIPGSGMTPEWAITGHRGGIAGELTSFHGGGLAPDEIMAKLRKAERILSPEQTKVFDRIMGGMDKQGAAQPVTPNINLNVNIENNTGAKIDKKVAVQKIDPKNYILNVVLRDYENYGPMRHLNRR